MLAVAAGGALRGVFGEGVPGLAVVEGDEGAVPGLAGDALGEGEGAGGEIDGVAFGGGGRELGEPWEGFGVGTGAGGPGELAVVEGEAVLGPGAAAEADLAKVLGVEEFVGEEDDLSGELDGLAEADGAEGAEGVVVVAEEASVGFGADFDPVGLAGVEPGVAEEAGGGFGDDGGEGVAQGGGGVEVGSWVEADAVACGGVVADLGRVEGCFDKMRQLDETIFVGERL